MQLIDVVAKHAGQQIAVSTSGDFIFWGSWQPVPAETVAAAKVEFAELEIKRKVDEINQRVCEMIAEQYSIADEIKLIRTAPSHEFDVYNEHAEACRQWGREQKAALGLTDEEVSAHFVPTTTISMRQARLYLHQAGLTEQVESMIASLDEAAQIEWQYAATVEIDWPLVQFMRAQLGLSDEQVQTMFDEAAKL